MTRNSDIADKPRDIFMQYAMAWLTPPPPPKKKTVPATRVTFPTSVFLGQTVCELIGGNQNLWSVGTLPLGTGTWLTPKTRPSPCVTTPNLVVLLCRTCGWWNGTSRKSGFLSSRLL